jgi:hypothetical protein
MAKRSLIVMLSLMMVMMAVGCDTGDNGKKEEDNPLNGKVIEEKYRGTYTAGYFSIVLSKDKFTEYYDYGKDKYSGSNDIELQCELWAYTEDTKLYLYDDSDKKWYWSAEFQDDNSYKRVVNGRIIGDLISKEPN